MNHLLLLLAWLLVIQPVTTTPEAVTHPAQTNQAAPDHFTSKVSLLTHAFEKLMDLEPSLDSKMQFISLDWQMTDWKLSEGERNELIHHFHTKYGVEILFDSYQQLKEKNKLDPKTNSLYGILLNIEKLEIHSPDSVTVTGGKYRSPLGAAGMTATWKKTKDGWEIVKLSDHWIS
ncbi:hypothetical protein NLX71_06775 [Paenibacillus sp. MZ04-78.2]|uniref:hypothetical protein n=1 Tax=Paenibacillus sp. MZ04-78.2 TaxID=2962034 RepID=UPI0020B74482|nr:hypothetical protein [Paenibacillus sp. MZ04-78.2]MCP3773024.1 hypothetical protein [Paenibacillus sp. MZ04-78.2]